VDGKLLSGRKEVVGDYVFKWPVKNTLSLGLLDGFSSLITLVSLIFYYLTNIRDVLKDY
jgi:hypothetical protein